MGDRLGACQSISIEQMRRQWQCLLVRRFFAAVDDAATASSSSSLAAGDEWRFSLPRDCFSILMAPTIGSAGSATRGRLIAVKEVMALARCYVTMEGEERKPKECVEVDTEEVWAGTTMELVSW